MKKSKAIQYGFTLIEVVLAVGVLGLSILALFGMFGPNMTSLRRSVNLTEAIAFKDAASKYFEVNVSRTDLQNAMLTGIPGDPSTVVYSVYVFRATDGNSVDYRFESQETTIKVETSDTVVMDHLGADSTAEEYLASSVVLVELYPAQLSTGMTETFTQGSAGTYLYTNALDIIPVTMSLSIVEPPYDTSVARREFVANFTTTLNPAN